MMTLISILSLITSPNPSITFPASIREEVVAALGHYPTLANVEIEFKLKKSIQKSTMLARPTLISFFQKRRKRSYQILISEKIKISGKEYKTLAMPSEVMIGWLGHELGHIMDYQNRSKLNLIGFGIKYLLLEKHMVKAERTADYFAIQAGMEKFILATKDFILNHADLDPTYVARIKKYYISPEEIMEMVKVRDQSKEDASTL
jgi:hypothetical protein